MTAAERTKNILLSAKLGPLTPFFGIVKGQCECGKPKSQRHKPGKHPNAGGWQRQNATSDHATIAGWIGKYTNAIFAVITGVDTVVLDLDVRPGKDGVAELAALEAEAGKCLPATVTVFSGSGTGAKQPVLQSSTRLGTAPEAQRNNRN